MSPSSTEAKECGRNRGSSSDKVGTVYFQCRHPQDMLCFFSPRSNNIWSLRLSWHGFMFLCQYHECTSSQTQLDEISSNNFQSFSYGMGCHKVEYTYKIWYSLITVRRQIDRLMCKPTLGQEVCPSALQKVVHLMSFLTCGRT